MTKTLRCPFCSSEDVYSLLNTFHCKRCKNLWKLDRKNPGVPDPGTSAGSVHPPACIIKKAREPLETRMEKKRDECLRRFHGRFSADGIGHYTGDIPPEVFRRYLRFCVKNRTLTETKDRYGRIWYSAPQEER